MGRDKALLEIGGQTLLSRTVAALHLVSQDIAIVGGAEYSGYGPTMPDLFPGCGPLAGIHAALAHSTAELNVIVAVDMPFVSSELLRFLYAAAVSSGAIVTVPRTARGFQPLCAVYRREFRPVAEQALRAGNYKVDAAFASVSLRILDELELAAAGFSEKNFYNVNTPEDLRSVGASLAP